MVVVGSTRLSLRTFSLTVQKVLSADGSIRVCGATAVFVVSAYAEETLDELARNQQSWLTDLSRRTAIDNSWTFVPETRASLTITLELPPGVAVGESSIAASAIAGTAIVIVELTEVAALTWMNALQQGAGSTLPGVFRVSATTPRFTTQGFGLEPRRLDTPVGVLLAARGPADIRVIDPQQTVSGRVVVMGSALVGTTTLTIRPNQGGSPVSAALGPGGGDLVLSVTSATPQSVTMGWTAEVGFTPPGWPVVPTTGSLDAARGWNTILKPEAWCVSYLLFPVAVDGVGRPQAANAQEIRVQGILSYSAPYISGGHLTSAFNLPIATPLNVLLPRYPDQPFGQPVLNVIATRNGFSGMASKTLGPDDVVLAILIHPNGQPEVRSSTDPWPENAATGHLLGALGQLS
ncbi:hypothetical protein GCM10020369_58330 [Cryptosporangium minutisporangium]|uniref:Uncharacterized protein n=2 Tax=Cryptosporangium minutisporangium TaxID=113569 RepID=A0ABP6T774_9ACTN